MSRKWELKEHEAHWEITNGPISLCTSEDEGEEIELRAIVSMLNDLPFDLHSENALELKQHIEVMQLQSQVQALQQWKKEASELLAPILEYGQGHPDIKLGSSIVGFVIERCKQYDELKEIVKDYTFKIAELNQAHAELNAENERLNNDLMSDAVRAEYGVTGSNYSDLLKEHAALKERAEALADSTKQLNERMDRMWNEYNLSNYLTDKVIELLVDAQRDTQIALQAWKEGEKKEGQP